MTVTQSSWARSLLNALHDPVNQTNVDYLVGWENAEGGNWNNTASYNPLNTTYKEPGSSSINSVGVQAYTSWGQGLSATQSTLVGGGYSDILSSLKRGQGLAGDSAGLSRWSGGGYSAITPSSGSLSGGSSVATTSANTTSSNSCPAWYVDPAAWAACKATGGSLSSNNPILNFFTDPVDALERMGLVIFGAMLILLGIAILGFGPATRVLGMAASTRRGMKGAGLLSTSRGPSPEMVEERNKRLNLAERNVKLGEDKLRFKQERESRLALGAEYKRRNSDRKASAA